MLSLPPEKETICLLILPPPRQLGAILAHGLCVVGAYNVDREEDEVLFHDAPPLPLGARAESAMPSISKNVSDISPHTSFADLSLVF